MLHCVLLYIVDRHLTIWQYSKYNKTVVTPQSAGHSVPTVPPFSALVGAEASVNGGDSWDKALILALSSQ